MTWCYSRISRPATAGCCLALLTAAALSSAGESTEPVLAGRWVPVAVDALLPRQSDARVDALGGDGVLLVVRALPASRTDWNLAYEGRSLAAARLAPDGTGIATVRLPLPDVRRRAACVLSVQATERRVQRELVVFPRAPLAGSLRRIEQMQPGILDKAGCTVRGLEAQGVRASDLSTDLALDTFPGQLAIVAGPMEPEELNQTCARLASRVTDGMSLLILNPPSGWQGWEITCVAPERPLAAAVEPAGRFAASFLSEDLRSGPWPKVLATDDAAVSLLKTRPYRNKADDPARALIATKTVGRGRVVVAALPHLEDPEHDPIGRCVLSDSILWILAQETRPDPTEPQP